MAFFSLSWNSLATIWELDISCIQRGCTCVPLQAALACCLCSFPRDKNGVECREQHPWVFIALGDHLGVAM